MLSTPLLCLVLLLAGADEKEVRPDVVELASGKKLEGRVLFEGQDELLVKAGRGEIEVARAQVTSIRSRERSLKEFLTRYDATRRGDTAAAAELARWCAEQGLEHEARNLWLRVALTDVRDERALEACGGRRIGEKVEFRDEKRWIEASEYRGPKERWRDRVTLRTAHFDVETDTRLEPVLEACVQVERHYLRFYETLGPELVLHVFEERPTIRIYADAQDFPQAWTEGDRTWFAPGENVLHVLSSERYDMAQMVRAVTDMLLFNACRRSSGKVGQVPGWVAAGISEFFAGTAPSEPFGSWGELGRPVEHWFQMQAREGKPVKLKTLLATSLGDLRRGPDAARRTAAAYTLCHFLVRGEGGAHREEVFAYLRDAWLGKIGATGLLKTLGLGEDELTQRWNAHVQNNS